jgi:hypothetical protein
LLVVAAPVSVSAQGAPKPTAPAHPHDALAWFAGCWEQRTPRRVVQETWLAPAGGTMLGISRTLRRGSETDVARDSMVEFEFMQLFVRDGRWIYAAQPSGRAPTEFVAGLATDTSVTFTNLQNDFPQQITYRRRGTDSLLARIEGPMNGTTRAIDFPYARVACAGSARR